MGSGTTAVASARNNRDFIGFESNDRYHRTALERVMDEVSKRGDFSPF